MSNSDDWETAVNEWEITDFDEDLSMEQTCVCGKEHIKQLFTIKNKHNNNIIFPIGSSCIKKFQVDKLNDEVKIYIQIDKLKQEAKRRNGLSKVPVSAPYYSKKLIKYIYDNGGFSSSKYNQYNPYNDYLFFLDMFNKKNAPTKKQMQKLNILLRNTVLPFLENFNKT